MTLALEHPPVAGEYRVFNQFEEGYSILELAEAVQQATVGAEIQHIENPRGEAEDHYYNPDHQHLLDLGYQPTGNLGGEIETMLADLLPHRERIVAHAHSLVSDVRWDGSRARCGALEEQR